MCDSATPQVEQIQMLKELPSGTLGEVLTNDAAIVEKWSPECLGESTGQL